MDLWDVVIIGAGPAGGQCARQLTAFGLKVLLAEKNNSFEVNSYSSGGAPLETLKDFSLPSSILYGTWKHLSLNGEETQHTWKSKENKGIVLDFAKLRQWLVQQAMEQGGEVRLGAHYVRHYEENGGVVVVLSSEQQECQVKTLCLVDATGSDRKVLGKEKIKKEKVVVATGIEHHVTVPPAIYQRYAETLSFYLGASWMPQGYGWVFPADLGTLKVGIIRFAGYEQKSLQHAYRDYLHNLTEKALGQKTWTISSRHGKALHYTLGRSDTHYNGRILAVGDAVSTLNPLAAEGIRHAMFSGNLAAEHILRFLKQGSSFESYQKELNKYCAHWHLCEKIMRKAYWFSNRDIDNVIDVFKGFSLEDILRIGFGYAYYPSLKFYAKLIWKQFF